jgi:dienelactone hydrolase
VSLVLALTVLSAAGQTLAGSLVEFANVLEHAKPTRISGYLSRPDGAGPFPAVVVLHGCGGISSHSIGIADELTHWGYVALTVDSLGPRAMTDACGQLFIGQATDAYAAARFLAQQPAVDQERIAMLGQSMGGSSALAALERGSIERRFPEKFAAAIAYYPSCSGHPPTLTAPTLILIGAAPRSSYSDEGKAKDPKRGHEGQFGPPRLSGRSAFCEETFAGRCGNAKDAPKRRQARCELSLIAPSRETSSATPAGVFGSSERIGRP